MGATREERRRGRGPKKRKRKREALAATFHPVSTHSAPLQLPLHSIVLPCSPPTLSHLPVSPPSQSCPLAQSHARPAGPGSGWQTCSGSTRGTSRRRPPCCRPCRHPYRPCRRPRGRRPSRPSERPCGPACTQPRPRLRRLRPCAPSASRRTRTARRACTRLRPPPRRQPWRSRRPSWSRHPPRPCRPRRPSRAAGCRPGAWRRRIAGGWCRGHAAEHRGWGRPAHTDMWGLKGAGSAREVKAASSLLYALPPSGLPQYHPLRFPPPCSAHRGTGSSTQPGGLGWAPPGCLPRPKRGDPAWSSGSSPRPAGPGRRLRRSRSCRTRRGSPPASARKGSGLMGGGEVGGGVDQAVRPKWTAVPTKRRSS
jgi:hypothetical protein